MRYAYVALSLVLVGCAGMGLQKTMKEQRGYSDAEVSEIMSAMEPYKRELISAKMESNRFNSAPTIEAEKKLKRIWCACWKKLSDKCRAPSAGLGGAEKELWRNANAVEMAFASQETALDVKANTNLNASVDCL
jgi:hypothetical protein